MAKSTSKPTSRPLPKADDRKAWKRHTGKADFINHYWDDREANSLMELYEGHRDDLWECMTEACERGFTFSIKYDTYTGSGFVATAGCLDTNNSLHKSVIAERGSTAERAMLKCVYVVAVAMQYGEVDYERHQDVAWF